MRFQAENVHESASLFNLKEKNLIRKMVGFEPTTQMVQYTTLTTRPLRICWIVVYLSTYGINPNPQNKNLTCFETVFNPNQ